MKDFLVAVVGFLMVQRELIVRFKLKDELAVLVAEVISILKGKGRNLRRHSELSQDVLEMKDAVQVFFTILETLGLTAPEPLRQQRTPSSQRSVPVAVQDVLYGAAVVVQSPDPGDAAEGHAREVRDFQRGRVPSDPEDPRVG